MHTPGRPSLFSVLRACFPTSVPYGCWRANQIAEYLLENVEHCGGERERERVRMWQRMAFAKRSMKATEPEMEAVEAEKTMVLVARSTDGSFISAL